MSFFEGAEKLLELWFEPIEGVEPLEGGLRRIPRETWDKILDSIRCTVLSTVHSSSTDAYLLSESSLFVTERRLIIKTCGQTNLLAAIPRVFELADSLCGLGYVEDLFYSHRRFARPELQPRPHNKWESEVATLNKHFSNCSGTYVLGDAKGESAWYLYTLTRPSLFSDQTFEIIMTDLPAEIEPLFRNDSWDNAKQLSEMIGLQSIMDDHLMARRLGSTSACRKGVCSGRCGQTYQLDDYLFDPCGYSANAIWGCQGEYLTVHITPECGMSYVSFETNIRVSSYTWLLERLLPVFCPSRYQVTLFTDKGSPAESYHHALMNLQGLDDMLPIAIDEAPSSIKSLKLGGPLSYRQHMAQFCRLPNTDLTYANYVRQERTEE